MDDDLNLGNDSTGVKEGEKTNEGKSLLGDGAGVEGEGTSQGEGDGAGGKSETPDDTVPETYDFKNVTLPENMELDDELTKEFSNAAKEMGLSQAKADKFMGMGVKLSTKLQEKMTEAFQNSLENQKQAYKTMLNSDPVIGGANLKQSLIEANVAYEKFVNDEAANLLAASGLNNHPAIVKVFREIGKQIKDDSISGGSNAGKHERTAADWYPKMNK